MYDNTRDYRDCHMINLSVGHLCTWIILVYLQTEMLPDSGNAEFVDGGFKGSDGICGQTNF